MIIVSFPNFFMKLMIACEIYENCGNVLAKFDVYEQYYKLNNEKHVLEDFTWICL